MRSYMIKFLAWIAYEQNRPTGAASALIAQFSFFGEKCLKNVLYDNFFPDKSCYKSKYTTFGAKFFLIAPWVWPLP